MKCKCLVPKNKNKGWKHRVYSVGEMSQSELKDWADFHKKHNNLHFNLEDYETCGGNLSGHVEAKDEPYFGGSSAELDVYFECDTCGCRVHKYLPDKYTIEEFLTNVIKEMS